MKPEAANPDYWDLWKISKLGWIRSLQSKQRGTLGKNVVHRLCSSDGIRIEKGGISPKPDFLIEGRPVVVRCSTLWASGIFKFQQFRHIQEFEYAICLGIAPFEVRCWVIDRDTLEAQATSQHSGQQGSDTMWLGVKPTDLEPWLDECGGDLPRALQILRDWQDDSTEV